MSGVQFLSHLDISKITSRVSTSVINSCFALKKNYVLTEVVNPLNTSIIDIVSYIDVI